MREEQAEMLQRAELLFHSLLFSYQKVIRNILGSGSAVFVHPLLDAIRKTSSLMGFDLIKGETIDEAFESYSKILRDSGPSRRCSIRKAWPRKMCATY